MNKHRRTLAWNKRQEANQMANQREHPRHISNGDERKFVDPATNGQTYIMSYTKGLPHDIYLGLVIDPKHFDDFVRAIDSGDPRDFRDVPLGAEENKGHNKCANQDFKWQSEKALNPERNADGEVVYIQDYHNNSTEIIGVEGNPVNVRAWESQSAGLAFELEGPDAQAVTMPPAPKLGSAELTAEMGEVYVQALLRDVPFNAFSGGVMGLQASPNPSSVSTQAFLDGLKTKQADVKKVHKFTKKLANLDWFKNTDLELTYVERARRKNRQNPRPVSAFRGITKGDNVGPYLSQFLLVGNTGINGNDGERTVADGLISYGGISVDQKVRTAVPGKDYMTNWHEWMDVQRGADLRGKEEYIAPDQPNARRFMHTPRDLATYVHYDALYEAYLNACLVLLGMGMPFDPGIPFQAPDNIDHQQGFAHFGGPHILSLVTEVATRALKAVRFQKYNVHRRCRPEVLAARIHRAKRLEKIAPEFLEMKNILNSPSSGSILSAIKTHNEAFAEHPIFPPPIPNPPSTPPESTYLLPMAFCEGSPMHPAYGAGHATVAGACITILKAFFDHSKFLNIVPFAGSSTLPQEVKDIYNALDINTDNLISANLAYVSTNNGTQLEAIPVLDENNKSARLTVEGELNKLASNISIGRNWAGVHYFTDYYESLLMGEEIAIGILEEQKLMFGENFSMTVPLFNGNSYRI